jgi:hypothetical protein
VELDELQIFVLEAGAGDHSGAVTRARVRRCRREISAAVTTSGQNGVLAVEAVEGAILKAKSHHANTLAIVHDEIQGEVLDEVGCVVAEGLEEVRKKALRNK